MRSPAHGDLGAPTAPRTLQPIVSGPLAKLQYEQLQDIGLWLDTASRFRAGRSGPFWLVSWWGPSFALTRGAHLRLKYLAAHVWSWNLPHLYCHIDLFARAIPAEAGDREAWESADSTIPNTDDENAPKASGTST